MTKGISVSALTLERGGKKIISNASFTLPPKGLIALLGPSGSGKTSLLETLAGFTLPHSGTITEFDAEITKMSEKERMDFRLLNLAYLPQNGPVFAEMTVWENVLFPLEKIVSSTPLSVREKGKSCLSRLGISDLAPKRANTLSGGERSRLLLSRSFLKPKKAYLLDEPTSALDRERAREVFKLLKAESAKCLIVAATHDQELANSFASCVLEIGNGEIREAKRRNEREIVKEPMAHEPIFAGIRKWSFRSLLISAFRTLSLGKFRSLVLLSALTGAFIVTGLSSFFARDVGNLMREAISTYVGEREITVSTRNEGLPIIGETVQATKDDISIIEEALPEIASTGVSYLAPFESFFPDENLTVVSQGGRELEMPSLNFRSFAECLHIGPQERESFFPFSPEPLKEEEICLGLPLESMKQLASFFELPIKEYRHVGDFLKRQKVTLLLKVENASWSYKDEQLFVLKGVKEAPLMSVFHQDERWNEWLVEFKMRFPVSNFPDYSKPWIMEKAHYVRTDNPFGLLESVRVSGLDESYVFSKGSDEMDSHSTSDNLTRFYVEKGEKNSLSFKEISALAKRGFDSPFLALSRGTFRSYPEQWAFGPQYPLFLSASESAAVSFSDLMGEVHNLADIALLDIPASSLMFSALVPRFANPDIRISEGGFAVSAPLAERLGLKDGLWISAIREVGLSVDDLALSYDYVKVLEVEVRGGDEEALFLPPYFLEDFLRARIGTSPELLESDSVIFKVGEQFDEETAISRMKEEFPAYEFVSSSAIVEGSLGETLGLVELLLNGAAVSFSLLALIVSASHSLSEAERHKREGRLLFELGFRRIDIFKRRLAPIALTLFLSVFLAIISLILIEKAAHFSIAKGFGVASLPFSFDSVPLLIVLSLGLSVFLLALIVILARTYRRNLALERRETQ